MKSHQMAFTNNFTHFYHQHAQTVVKSLLKTLHNFWNYGKLETRFYQEQPYGDTVRGLNLMKYTLGHRLVLPCTVTHLLRNILQKQLSPRTQHYSIYYIRIFLWILILVYTYPNTAINSSTSSCASNIWVTPFSSQSMPSTRLRIIILKPSDC